MPPYFPASPVVTPPASNLPTWLNRKPTSMWGNPNPTLADVGAARPGVPTGAPPANPELDNAMNTAGTVNNFNLGYYQGAQQNDPAYASAMRLLNPNDAQANYDVTMQGAELATSRGVSGSPLAGETTGRIRQADIERRAALGNNILSSVHGRVPQPYDLGNQILTAYQRGELSLQQLQLLLGQLRGAGGGGGRIGSGGGGGIPRLPGTGGGAPSQAPSSAAAALPPWPGEPNQGGVWYDSEGNPHSPSERPARDPYGYSGGPDDPLFNSPLDGNGAFFVDPNGYPDVPDWTWFNPADNTYNYAPAPITAPEDSWY